MQVLDVPPNEENGYTIKAAEGKEERKSYSVQQRLFWNLNIPLQSEGNFWLFPAVETKDLYHYICCHTAAWWNDSEKALVAVTDCEMGVPFFCELSWTM